MDMGTYRAAGKPKIQKNWQDLSNLKVDPVSIRPFPFPIAYRAIGLWRCEGPQHLASFRAEISPNVWYMNYVGSGNFVNKQSKASIDWRGWEYNTYNLILCQTFLLTINLCSVTVLEPDMLHKLLVHSPISWNSNETFSRFISRTDMIRTNRPIRSQYSIQITP